MIRGQRNDRAAAKGRSAAAEVCKKHRHLRCHIPGKRKSSRRERGCLKNIALPCVYIASCMILGDAEASQIHIAIPLHHENTEHDSRDTRQFTPRRESVFAQVCAAAFSNIPLIALILLRA